MKASCSKHLVELWLCFAMMALPCVAGAERRVTEETLIFRRLRGGVCTVYADGGQGTGFLVDSTGLILTNDHVAGGSSRLRVKFDDSTRVEAVFITSNSAKDVAVIRVNPEVVAGYPVFKLATPSDSMVFEGEKAIAMGSPLNQEKIMTSGIISKVEKAALISDVNINHGNSGGPLVNMDGEVIAINTFGDFTSQGGPGISGSVNIGEAYPVLSAAHAMLDTLRVPSPRRLPVASRIPFPIDSLRAVAEYDHFDERPYNISGNVGTGKFTVTVITPVYATYQNYRYTVVLSKRAKKREAKGGVASADQVDPMRQMRSWMYLAGDNAREMAPVVTFQMTPKIGQTAGSIFGNILGGVAAGMANTSYRGNYRYEYKADFKQAQVLSDSSAIEDLNMFRTMVPQAIAQSNWNATYSMEDEARTGILQFNPSVFKPNGDVFPNLHMKIWSVEKPNNPYEFDIPQATVKRIWDDFKTWRDIAGQ